MKLSKGQMSEFQLVSTANLADHSMNNANGSLSINSNGLRLSCLMRMSENN